VKVLILAGATATGKSTLAMELAREYSRDIISADSRQVYQGLRVGTAQASPEDKAAVPHHFQNFLSPDEQWSAQGFSRNALSVLREKADQTPIVVGGTGFYLKSLMEGLSPLSVSRSKTREIRKRIESLSTEELRNQLSSADPESAERIHQNDRQRILRALEVYLATGETLTDHHRKGRESPEDVEWKRVLLSCARSALHQNIEDRLDRMLDGSWQAEVRELMESGVNPEAPGMQTLGYPEVLAILRGDLSLKEAREKILIRTRQYARRQEIWFRKQEFDLIIQDLRGDGAREIRHWLAS
jgi:tRNA dimethylallyltransferase